MADVHLVFHVLEGVQWFVFHLAAGLFMAWCMAQFVLLVLSWPWLTMLVVVLVCVCRFLAGLPPPLGDDPNNPRPTLYSL